MQRACYIFRPYGENSGGKLLDPVAPVCEPAQQIAGCDVMAATKLLQRGTKIVDLSADFRLRDVAVYEEWYRHTHPAPALLETAAYGLCERYRGRIERAELLLLLV